MDYLSRDQILGADDLTRATVDVPEWGGTLLVRALTGAERGRLESGALKQRGAAVAFQPQSLETVRGLVVSMAAIDAEGRQLFTFRDVVALSEKSGAALERVFDVVAALSGITEAAISELTEDFDSGPSAGSGSG